MNPGGDDQTITVLWRNVQPAKASSGLSDNTFGADRGPICRLLTRSRCRTERGCRSCHRNCSFVTGQPGCTTGRVVGITLVKFQAMGDAVGVTGATAGAMRAAVAVLGATVGVVVA
jgi:hypothetical protein